MSLGGGERQRESFILIFVETSFASSHIANSKYEEALTIAWANLKCSILVISNPTPLCNSITTSCIISCGQHKDTVLLAVHHCGIAAVELVLYSPVIIQNYLHDNTKFDNKKCVIYMNCDMYI